MTEFLILYSVKCGVSSLFPTFVVKFFCEDIKMSFSEVLKDLRLEKGVTQTELAKYCGVSSQCISSLEVGRRNPTGSTLEAISKYFNVSVDYLLGRTDDFGAAVPVEQNLSRDEREVLALYGSLSPARKEDLLIFLRALSGTSSSGVSKKKA